MKYAITGATGGLGSAAVHALLRRGVAAGDVVAVVRDEAKAADLAAAGVEVRHGDYDEPASLPTALYGVDRVLLVSGNEPGKRVPQHTAVIDAAKAAQVQRIAYTSILNADDTTNPLAAEHVETEKLLRASGLEVTLLRNGWYVENYTRQVDTFLAHGITGAAGDGEISGALRAEYAEAAAAALLADSGTEVVHELGGPGFTYSDLAAAFSDVTGTNVGYTNITVEQLTRLLEGAGTDADAAAFVAGLDAAIARGDLHTDSQDLATLLGRPATPLREALATALAAR